MSKWECGGAELGDHSEPMVLEKDKGGVYALDDPETEGNGEFEIG